MAIQATQIRKGMVILHNNVPHRVLEFHHHTPGNLRAMVQTRLRNLMTGNTTEHRFRSTEAIEKAVFEEVEMNYMYSDAEGYHFMNMESYEQIALNEETLGDAVGYLLEGTTIKVEFFNGNPIGIELPLVVELKVVETEPELKGATVSNVNKPAKLETGITIAVPPFIKEGEKIRVDTTEGRYIERAR